MEIKDEFNDIPNWNHFNFKYHDEEVGEEWKNLEKKQTAERLYNQASKIYTLAKIYAESLKGERAEFDKTMIMENVLIICPKIIGAEAGDLYVLRMENASIIRTNIRQLYELVKAGQMFESSPKDYTSLLIEEIENFKFIFKEWVSLFKKDEFSDEWGLF
jgi:hypothetical protein